MKKVLTGLFALVVTLFGATKLNLVDVRPIVGGPVLYLAGVSAGSWIPVALDPAGSIIVDTSTIPAVLRAVGSAAVNPAEDDFTVALGVTAYTTTGIPKGGMVDVFKDGQLQRKGDDYLAGGSTAVTISFTQPLVVGSYITLRYLR